MACTSDNPATKSRWLLGGVVAMAVALILPWKGFDFTLLGKQVHLHSLKNPLGAFLILMGLRFLIQLRRGTECLDQRLDDWDSQHPLLIPWLLGGISFVLFTNAKLFQHFSLQTHAYDLGIFANICWNTLHGRALYDSVMGASYLGDHFQPVLFLLAPALWLWNNAGVFLIIQSLGLGLAVPPLFWLVKKAAGRGSLAAGFCLVYLAGPYLTTISVFDFHPIALAIPVFLWALMFLETGRSWAFLGLCCLALTLKEDVPFALTALGALLAIKNSPNRKMGLALIVLGITAFAIETQVVIPHFLKNLSSVHFDRYSHLGESYTDIVINAVANPQRIIRGVLFPKEKWWSLLKYLGSFAFLPLLSPADFFPGLMALLPHLLSRYSGQYTLAAQYTALAYPFTLHASALGLGRIKKIAERATPKAAGWLFSGCLLLSGGALLANSRYGHTPDWGRVAEFRKLIAQIPPQATVRAQSDLLPHVAMRRTVRLFAPYELYKSLPLFEMTRMETDYIVLDCYGNFWPMNESLFRKEILDLASNGRYSLIQYKDGFELWKRKES